ncbi:hypothetical protein [Agrobacterium sp. M50-1]|jgi:sugar/nucleoside kinase (ribokinase family)|uniref:hypothetical protein n=1 Tax=Agrobacterium sp. M50-1 TaxID=3132821 RepID=UPI003CE5A600
MAAAAPIFMGLSGIVGAVGQYQAGNYAAAQSKRAAQVGRIQADQIDASYRDELNSTLANIKSIRASAGVDPNSPTGQAVNADQVRTSNRDRIIDVGSKRMQANQDEADAKFRKSAAKVSLLGGTMKALPSFFGA